jgi:hypothetical protein
MLSLAVAKFGLCIRNEDCEDLEPRKHYRVLPVETAAADGYLRVIDESGEDYLYPKDYFLPIELPQAAEKALLAAAWYSPAPQRTRHERTSLVSCVGEPLTQALGASELIGK